MEQTLKATLQKKLAYIRELLNADALLEEATLELAAADEPRVDRVALAESYQNRLLASTGTKAELLGTGSTEPTADRLVLNAIDPAVEAERDRIRSQSLALTRVITEEPIIKEAVR